VRAVQIQGRARGELGRGGDRDHPQALPRHFACAEKGTVPFLTSPYFTSPYLTRRDKSINLVLSDVTMESMSDGCCGQGLFTPLAVNR